MFISILYLWILINVWTASSSKTLNIGQNIPKYGWKHGADGGSPFDDQAEIEFPDRTPCMGVEVIERPGFFGGLRFLYGSHVDHAQWSSFHGDPNAPSTSKENFMMEAGERITEVTTYVGNRKWPDGVDTGTFVLGIRFGTNKGRSSRVFGSKDGEKKVETQDDYVFGYATGRSGFLLDQLLVVWQNQETVKVNAKNHFTALCSESPESLSLAIISAFYRNKDKPKLEVKDVGDRVRQRCNNEKSCTFIVADKVLEKIPCESCEKELEVTYTCSSQELIFGPEFNDRLYKGDNIIINGKKYVIGMDDYLGCGEYCLKEPRCVGIQFSPNLECYLKSAMEAYVEETGWMSMAVVNRSRDT